MKNIKFALAFSILIGIIFFSITSTLAFDTHKQSTNYNLIISSNNATQCNLTYIQTNGNLTAYNLQMSKNIQDFSILVNSNNFTQLGDTCLGITCSDGINIATGSKCLTITPTGYQASSAQTTIMFFIVGSIFLVGLLLFLYGMSTSNPPIKLFCLSIVVILIVFLIGYIMKMAEITIGEFTDLTNSFSAIYLVFIGLLTVGGICLMIYLVIFGVVSFSKYRGLRE